MTAAPRTIATTALASEALGVMNAPQDHHALRHGAGGAGAAGRHPARPRLPARRRRLSHGGRAGAAFAGRRGPQGRAAAGGARDARLALPGADRRPARRQRRVLARATSTALGSGLRDPATRPSPAPPAARTASASPPRWWSRTRRRPSTRAITALSRHARAARRPGGRRAGRRPAISTSRRSGSTLAGNGADRHLGRLPDGRADQATLDLRAGTLVAGDKREDHRTAGADRSRASLHVAPAAPTARRVGFRSETACGWYTIRRLPE